MSTPCCGCCFECNMEFNKIILPFIIAIAQIAIGATANSLVIIAFIVKRQLRRTPSDLLLLNLAVADLFALTIYLPWHTYWLVQRFSLKQFEILSSLNIMSVICSSFSVVAIAIDRFTGIVLPLRYKAIMTRKACSIMITTLWITGVFLGVSHWISYRLEFHDMYFRKCICAINLTQLLLISVLYIFIFKAGRKHVEKEENWRRNHNPQEQIPRRIMFKPVWKTLYIVFLSYITLLPYEIYRIFTLFDSQYLSASQKVDLFSWLNILTFINCCINPFIYCYGNQRIRTVFRSFFKM